MKQFNIIPEHALVAYKQLMKLPKEFVTRTFRGKLLVEYMTPLEKEGLDFVQKSALIGTLLGDATLQYGQSKRCSLKFEQKAFEDESKNDYIYFLYSIFHDFVGTPPKKRYLPGKILKSLWFRTYSTELFDFYAKQFYSIDALGNRQKVVPKNIHQWLNPMVLSFWFMDDGSFKGSGYVLHTEGFLLPDIKILQQALGTVFGLQTSVQTDKKPNAVRTYYRLYIGSAHKEKFYNIVEPYILPSKEYKTGITKKYIYLDAEGKPMKE